MVQVYAQSEARCHFIGPVFAEGNVYKDDEENKTRKETKNCHHRRQPFWLFSSMAFAKRSKLVAEKYKNNSKVPTRVLKVGCFSISRGRVQKSRQLQEMLCMLVSQGKRYQASALQMCVLLFWVFQVQSVGIQL